VKAVTGNMFYGSNKKIDKSSCYANKFSNARIAFEVELKTIDHTECSHNFVEWFISTYIFGCHADKPGRSFKHLTLDFSSQCHRQPAIFLG
jgi:hypothetical protein